MAVFQGKCARTHVCVRVACDRVNMHRMLGSFPEIGEIHLPHNKQLKPQKQISLKEMFVSLQQITFHGGRSHNFPSYYGRVTRTRRGCMRNEMRSHTQEIWRDSKRNLICLRGNNNGTGRSTYWILFISKAVAVHQFVLNSLRCRTSSVPFSVQLTTTHLCGTDTCI